MKTIRRRSGMPYLLSALVVLLYAAVFGLGSLLGYAGALLLVYLIYAPIARLFPDRYVVVEEFPKAKDRATNALIQECAGHMRNLRAAGDTVYDPWLLEKVDIIAVGYRGLLRALSEDSKLLEPMDPYLRYLLPNTVMLLNVRVKLQDRHLDADKVQTRRRIDESLIAIEQSIEKELTLLNQQQPLQVAEDVQQLKHMLGQSGILETDAAAPIEEEILAAIPERSPAELIVEQLGAQRQDLLQVLKDRLAAVQADMSPEEIELPSVYAASAAVSAPALVVPAMPEVTADSWQPLEEPSADESEVALQDILSWTPQLSLEEEPAAVPQTFSYAEEGEDIQAARAQLIALLDEAVQKLEREAEQERLQSQHDVIAVSESLALDRLIAEAQSAFLTDGTQAETQKWNEQPAEAVSPWETMAEPERPSEPPVEGSVWEPLIEPEGSSETPLEASQEEQPVGEIITGWWTLPELPAREADKGSEARAEEADLPAPMAEMEAEGQEAAEEIISAPEALDEFIAQPAVPEAVAPQDVEKESFIFSYSSSPVEEVEQVQTESESVVEEEEISATPQSAADIWDAGEAFVSDDVDDISEPEEILEEAEMPAAVQTRPDSQDTGETLVSDDATDEEEREAKPTSDLPQAGNWFSMEGFEEEDDLPVYSVAKPWHWTPPPPRPKVAPSPVLDVEEEALPIFEEIGTDVPSVMDSSEHSSLPQWYESPVMREEKPVELLADAMRSALLAAKENLQEGQTDRLSAQRYLEEIGKQFSVALETPSQDFLSETPEEEPAQDIMAQRGRMTSLQIDELVLGDILHGQGMKDFGWQEANPEGTARMRRPRMEINKSVLMALLGHDGTESAYLQ